MPMLNKATAKMTARMTPPELNNSVAEAEKFAALPLPADFIFPDRADRILRTKLQAYLDALPLGIQETIRATVYMALRSDPPKQMNFVWAGAYDYKIEFTETFDTYQSPRTAGVIGVTLSGRYPDDPHPLASQIAPPQGRGGRTSSSKRSSKGAPNPAKRKSSKSS